MKNPNANAKTRTCPIKVKTSKDKPRKTASKASKNGYLLREWIIMKNKDKEEIWKIERRDLRNNTRLTSTHWTPKQMASNITSLFSLQYSEMKMVS